jgi:hypothetical protein
MTIRREIAAEGNWTLCFLVENEKNRVLDFLEGLGGWERARMAARFDRIRENGPPHSRDLFANEGDGIWAIKADDVRVYCFHGKGRTLILTNGSVKKRRKADPAVLKEARRLRKAFLEATKKGTTG